MILVNRHFRFGYPRDHNIMPLICFCPYSRMMRAVTPVRGAPFMKGMLVGLMTFFSWVHRCARIGFEN